jgi:hypothetical protein
MLPKYMQDGCGSNFVWSPSQMFQHLFNIIPSYQSMFDGNIQCFPQHSCVNFPPQWPSQMPFVVPIVE